MLGSLSPDIMSSLFSGFSGGFSSHSAGPASSAAETSEHPSQTDNSPDSKLSETTVPLDNTPTETTSGDPDFQPEHTSQAIPLPDEIPTTPDSVESAESEIQPESSAPTDDLYNSLYSFLTPEQQKIYEQLMHTD